MRKYMTAGFLALALLTACSSSKKTGSSTISNTSTKKLPSKMERSMLDNNTFRLTAITDDKTYGYTEKNPVKVGDFDNGPLNERRFLNALTGPNGEAVSYYRKGSCCYFKSPNGFMGGGLLDMYEVTYEGITKPVILYINMYDADELKAPVGFKFRE